MKSHRIINLVSKTTGHSYSFSIGTLTHIEGNWRNGLKVDLTDATILYDFCKDHVGEEFYINGLVGLVASIVLSSTNQFFKNAEKTVPWEVYRMNINILNSGTTRIRNIDVYPYFNGVDHIYSPSAFTTGNMPTSFFGQCFCWDNTKNNLTVASLGYYSTYYSGLGVYEITPSKSIPDINGIRYGGTISVKNLGDRTQVTPVWNEWNFMSLWEYIFTKYNTTTNTDKDDINKQKPIEWKYPQSESGGSKPVGGDGDQKDYSDIVNEEDIIDGLSSDFVKLYKISKENLKNLADYLLEEDFLTNIKKLYNNPIDAIVSLNAMPISVGGVVSNIKTSGIDTGVKGVLVENTIINFDFGTIKINEYWGSFLDYETKINIYLPYIGIQPINTDDFMNDEISVNYRIDLLTGSFVAFIKNSKGIIHQTTGNMAYHLPVTSVDYSRLYSSIINGVGDIAKGDIVGTAISTVQNLRPSIHMKGNFNGNVGVCSNKKPYLIIERPVLSVPDNFSELKGNKSNVSAVLGTCTGFTKVSDIKFTNVKCTNEEKAILESLLKEGVFF